MGDWDRNANSNRDVLERIVALLFALANLAELAAGLPFLRRRQALEILSCGEVEARAFVTGMVLGGPVPADMPERVGASRLAASFRALALLLCALLARPFALRGAAGLRVDRCKPARPASYRAVLPAPDTS
jgi:hypothetical protein